MIAAPPTDSPPRAPSPSAGRFRFRDVLFFVLGAVVVPLVILALFVAGTAVSFVVSTVCFPPSAAELEAQRTFVATRLPDARVVEVGHEDCDDHGTGYVDFTTPSSPAAAARRFLADPACTAADDQGVDPGDAAVECKTPGFTSYLYFEASASGLTEGDLGMERA